MQQLGPGLAVLVGFPVGGLLGFLRFGVFRVFGEIEEFKEVYFRGFRVYGLALGAGFNWLSA